MWSLGACLLLCTPWLSPRTTSEAGSHWQDSSPPSSASTEGIIRYHPLGLGFGSSGRAQVLAVPLPCALLCAPKPQPYAPSLHPLPIPKAEAAEIPSAGRPSPSGNEQGSGLWPGSGTA